MTPGRVEWTARAIKKRLRPEERAALEPVADDAEGAGRHGVALRVTREKAKAGVYSDVATEKNTAMDHASSGVHGYLDVLTRVYPVGSELGDRARRLVERFFPQTLKQVTNSAFTEELSLVRRIVTLAKGELASEVAAVPGLAPLFDELEARAVEFEDVLEREASTAPSYLEAEAAAAAADRRMVDLVNAIQFVYRGDGEEAARRRTELLAPYVLQQASLRERYRRRARNPDIDPETGEDLPDDDALELELDDDAGTERDPVSA